MKKKSNKTTEKGFFLTRISRGVLIALGCIFAVIVLLAGVLVGTFFALKTAGRASMTNRRENAVTVDSSETSYEFDSDVVVYNGKRYRMNKNITNFLFMGVDTGKTEYSTEERISSYCKEKAERTGVSYESVYNEVMKQREEQGLDSGVMLPGQADTILLLALDEENKHVSIISVDRNSMSYFETYDPDGNLMGTSEGQLALAYSYGDGGHQSCRMTVAAVSDFLYEIPIHAYYSMKFAAVKELNDAVGGVEVTIPTDMTMVDESFVEGSRVLLDGKQAESFISARQNVGDGSNAGRIERQKLYILSFIESAVKAVKSDLGLPLELYNRIAKNSYTDLTASEIVYLANFATDVDISFHSIKGTTNSDGFYAEFRPDEDALWQLILDIFYICEE